MTDLLKTGSKLALICAVAALCLGAVNMVTEPRIAQFRIEKLNAALQEVSPGGEIGELTEADDSVVKNYYEVRRDGAVSGYILNLTGNGYAGDLVILASYKPDGTLLASVLLENEETPGLGKEAEKDGYMEKYYGFVGDNIPSSKNRLPQDEADAVSGATITFSAIGKALAGGSEYVISKGDM